MNMNKYRGHVYVIPEDDADRQIADGFTLHHGVNDRRIQVMPVAGGWRNVLQTFETEYLATLRNTPLAHVVLLIDFDGHAPDRRLLFEETIPDDLRSRVFVIGPGHTPETLKIALNKSFEAIGRSLADDCYLGTAETWEHEQLSHNEHERQRLIQTVRPFLLTDVPPINQP
jgi:hypothetical protein